MPDTPGAWEPVMTSTTLLDNGNYSYLVDIQPTGKPDSGDYHLRISTRWLGARNPDALLQRFSICLDRQGLQNLRQLIDTELGNTTPSPTGAAHD